MLDKIEQLRKAAAAEISAVADLQTLETYRIRFLARKGRITELFDAVKSVSAEDRPKIGKALNDLRAEVQKLFDDKKNSLENLNQAEEEHIDVTLPGRRKWIGSKHPLTQTLDEIKKIFFRMGFDVAYGPEIEDDYHNFEALNFPPDHPARDMQDTFFISEKV